MKNITGLAIAVILSFVLAACGGGAGAASIRSEASVITAGAETEAMEGEKDMANAGSTVSVAGTIGTAGTTETENQAVMKMKVQVGETTFTATLEDNSSAEALVRMMESAPVVVQMSDYSGFEKVGSLGTSLPENNSQMTTQAGDIVLYHGDQIVIFYGSNSWSYTRLGQIDDLSGWSEALGSGDVTVTFSVEQVQAWSGGEEIGE